MFGLTIVAKNPLNALAAEKLRRYKPPHRSRSGAAIGSECSAAW